MYLYIYIYIYVYIHIYIFAYVYIYMYIYIYIYTDICTYSIYIYTDICTYIYIYIYNIYIYIHIYMIPWMTNKRHISAQHVYLWFFFSKSEIQRHCIHMKIWVSVFYARVLFVNSMYTYFFAWKVKPTGIVYIVCMCMCVLCVCMSVCVCQSFE